MKRLALLAFLVPQMVLAQKIDGRLDCKHAGKDFVYECRIRLARGGEPLTGVQVTVGADMPSMPMAHQVKPVKAQPTKTPGEYRALLDLEMSGEWAVKLRLSGAVRDQLVLHYTFTEPGRPPRK